MTLLAPPRAVSAPLSHRAARFLMLPEVRWAGVASLLFALGGVAELAGAPSGVWWTLYLGCYAAGGWEPALAGVAALRERTLDVDLLMIVAAVVAAAIGQVLDGALLIVIFATSGALEAVATKRTQDSVSDLLDLAPSEATLVLPDSGERRVLSAELRVGDSVLVRPGERITADGIVTAGASEADQASITGEPLPVAKTAGDEVFAGTVNGTGALIVQVTRDPGEWVLARIVTLVEQASATKARTQLFIDKVEQRYSVGMVTVTVALLVLPLLFGAALQPSLLRAMTFMIVASPCAMVLATMPPLLSAIANAGRHGVLVKSAVVMEQLADIDHVAFDKAGTLTAGHPVLVRVSPLEPGLAENTLLALAASVERDSEHPLGRAIVAAALERGITLSPPRDFASTPGRGVRADIDGHLVTVERPARDQPESTRHLVAEAEAAGQTVVMVLRGEDPAGMLCLTDRLRPDAPSTVSALAAAGLGMTLLTGDNTGAAGAVGRAAGIAAVRAELLPHDKVEAVTLLGASGARVLAVGDGVNDAAMLATAHTGLALGSGGADLTLDAADAVLVRTDLAAIPAVLRLARRARRTVVVNLAIAAAVITGLVLWDLLGHLPLPLGVAGHEGSTVIVGLNGLRLLRRGAWTGGTTQQ